MNSPGVADARQAMSPEPIAFAVREAMLPAWAPITVGPYACGGWRCLPTWANRQPEVAKYLRHHSEAGYRAFDIDVLRVEDGLSMEVTSFPPDLFGTFDLPLAP